MFILLLKPKQKFSCFFQEKQDRIKNNRYKNLQLEIFFKFGLEYYYCLG